MVEDCSDHVPEVLGIGLLCGPEPVFELRECLLDRIEVRLVLPVGSVDPDLLAGAAMTLLAEEGSLDGATLERLRGIAGSSGGARPKALVHRDPSSGAIYADASSGRQPWIVKFHAPGEGPDTGAVEAACAILARRAGLEMAETTLLPSTIGAGWFATRRFDRTAGEGRAHMLSLAGLLEADWRMPSVGYRTHQGGPSADPARSGGGSSVPSHGFQHRHP